MFPLPTKGEGRLVVAVGRVPLGDDKYRELGQELNEAFDWPPSALQSYLKMGILQFVPRPPFDTDLPRELLEHVPPETVRELCKNRNLDTSGTDQEVIHRLLVATGYAGPNDEEARTKNPTPAPEAMRMTAREVPKADLPPQPVPTFEPKQRKTVIEELSKCSVGELRTNVAPLYGVAVDPGESKESVLAKLVAVIEGAPTPTQDLLLPPTPRESELDEQLNSLPNEPLFGSELDELEQEVDQLVEPPPATDEPEPVARSTRKRHR